MVKDFTDFALVETEVTVGHMAESDHANEDQHPRVVAMAVGLKRIVTDLVAVGLVMHVVFLLEVVRMRIRREDLLMTTKQLANGKQILNFFQ